MISKKKKKKKKKVFAKIQSEFSAEIQNSNVFSAKKFFFESNYPIKNAFWDSFLRRFESQGFEILLCTNPSGRIVIVISFYLPSCLGKEKWRDLTVFESSCHLPTCLLQRRGRLHTVPSIAEGPAGKLWMPLFIVFGLTRLGIKPESTTFEADCSIHLIIDW